VKRWWLFLFFGLALAQGALDAREALRLALAQNPTYQNAREALQTAQLELEALRADPSTLILPLTQAEHALALAEVQAKAAALSLLEEVLSAYTALAEAQGQEAVLLKKKALQERNLAVARAKRQAGNATELEVIQAEAALRQAEEDLKAALALRPARVKALEAALGIAVDEPRLAPLPEPQALGTELEALREGLEERLPALVQARQNLALAELEVRLADTASPPGSPWKRPGRTWRVPAAPWRTPWPRPRRTWKAPTRRPRPPGGRWSSPGKTGRRRSAAWRTHKRPSPREP